MLLGIARLEELSMELKGLTVLTVFVLLALPSNALAVDITEVGSIPEDAAAAIQNAFDASGIPSVHLALVVNDSLQWAKGYGEQPLLDTGFRTGSITKTFTAAALVKLYENGTIDLDDDVSDYLPFQVRNPNEPNTVITIRMILEHKAGMSSLYQFGQPWSDPILVQVLSDNGIPTQLPEVPNWNGTRLPLRDIINSTNINDPDAWLPSTGTYAYSNTGYLFLSFLLEHIISDTWSNYIHHAILSPLGMNSTGFNVTQYENPVAFPHVQLSNGSLLRLPVYRDYGYGAGGLITTVTDLSKFIIAVTNGGWYGDVQLFQPQYIPLMLKYLQLIGSMVGYGAQVRILEESGTKLATIMFSNGPGSSSTIYNKLLKAALTFIPRGDTPPSNPTTTTTLPPPLPEYLMLGGIALVGVVVVMAIFVVLKRR